MTKLMRWMATIAATATLTGCAIWTKLDGGPVSHAGVGMNAPANWVHLAAKKDGLLITRDGSLIQFIEVAYLLDDKIFPKSKQVFSKDAAPQDMAQRFIGELRQSPGLTALEVKETAPTTVAGRPGFRTVIEWKNDRGATFQRVIAGAAIENGLFIVQYQALKRYFFARDLPEFERALASAKRT